MSPLKADELLVAIEYWNLLPKILRKRRPGDLPVPVGPYSVQRVSIRWGGEKLFLGCASVRTGLALISVMVVVCASH